MFKRHFSFILICFVLLYSCKPSTVDYKSKIAHPDIFHNSVKSVTDVIVHDIFSPPVASRIYTYCSIGAYEAVRYKNPEQYPSLAKQIIHLDSFPKPLKGEIYDFEAVGSLTYLMIGKSLIFSEDSIQNKINELLALYSASGMPDDVLNRSQDFAQKITNHITQWYAKDNYKQTRSFPKYSVQNDGSTWQPTPPGYMDGIEPSWNKIRPFTLISADQFKPEPPTPFNIKDKNSLFYKEMLEVYDAVNSADKEKEEIARFWDCNPYMLNITGHVMHATKKISPGGHWINITALACKKAQADVALSAKAYAMVSIGLADAFISCWDEKYRSILIRPETIINEVLDPEWRPILQTPPFPEYTSGHSVASAASATILTHIFGDNFDFVDNTEIEFGLPSRTFTSFNDAASEAAISRLYGGIHYRPAIVNGQTQGVHVGQHVINKIKI